jgi:hypothetical protein
MEMLLGCFKRLQFLTIWEVFSFEMASIIILPYKIDVTQWQNSASFAYALMFNFP